MKFNLSNYSEKFLCSFYQLLIINCVGLDDNEKSILVEKQQNDLGPSSNSLFSKPVKRKRGGKMEKEEKEHLDHLFLGGNKFILC